MRVLGGGSLARDRGFSLVEVMAALTVFAIMTVGITPLLVSSLRGSNLSRSFTRSKNLASEALERIRGLPYFDTGAGRDVLDLYFPNMLTGYNPADQTFTTICTPTSETPAATGPLACPPDLADGSSRIPSGHTVTFVARFVVPTGTDPETFATQPPPTGYTASDPALATPPAQLLRISVTVAWDQLGPREFQLESLIGDRKLSPDRARAAGTIDYVVEATTSYKRVADGRRTRLTASSGRAIADIEIRNFASASVEAEAGELTLSAQETATETGELLETVLGASSARLTAPPNQSPLPAISDSDPDASINHPDLAFSPEVAHLANESSVNEALSNAEIEVTNNLPRAVTQFALNPGVGIASIWVDNQADTSATAIRKLDPFSHVLTISKLGSARLSGTSTAEATAVLPTASRKVESTATAGFGKMVLLPTSFIGGDKGVIVIENFSATLTCRSTGSLASAVATGSWSATIKYWSDTNNNGLQSGSYKTLQTASTPGVVTGSTTSSDADPFNGFTGVNNPLVYDSLVDANDVYLFEETGKIGYLTSFDIDPLITAFTQTNSSRVAIEQAMNIVTAQTDPLNEETQLTIGIGKLACEAADRRE